MLSPKTLVNKLPLVVLGGGAGAVFLSNILAKKVFSAAQFIDWAYLTALTTLFFSFSLLGSEQLIIRSAQERDGRVELPRGVAAIILASFLGFATGYVFLLDGYIFEYRLGVRALPILMVIGITQVAYQLERVQGRLLASQLALNAWKLALLPLVAISARETLGPAPEVAMISALLVGLVYVATALVRSRARLALSTDATDASRVFFPFMLSLGLLAGLNMADRVVIERLQSPAVFAEYVYLSTLLVTPFTILASYFGFKEAVRYRRSYSRRAVRRDAVRTMASALVLVGAWSAVCYLTKGFTGISFDPVVWVLLGGLATLRCGYGVVSAAMGVRGSASAIYLSNFASGVALILFGALAVTAQVSIRAAVAGYTLVWAVRFIAYFSCLGKDETVPSLDSSVRGLA